MSALRDINWVDRVDLASELRSRVGDGKETAQQSMIEQAKLEVERILQEGVAWDAWVTYHNYYKAPDLVGPAVSRALNIPYFQIEASRSPKQLHGPWSVFAGLADAASDAASAIFYFTGRDFPELEKAKPDHQKLVHLRPFLNRAHLEPQTELPRANRLIAVGMFRFGDKLASYRNLANALEIVTQEDWVLGIVGDGPAKGDVVELFAKFGPRVTFWGELSEQEVREKLAQSDVFVWPGVNEAFGMVYLEAQAVGLPIVAEDRVGVREVVGSHSHLVPPNSSEKFADAILKSLSVEWDVEQSREFVRSNHLRSVASATLAQTIGMELEERQ